MSSVPSAFADDEVAPVVDGLVKGLGAEARSARREEALLRFIRSWPRSWRRESIIDVICSEERRGLEQKVQGPRPSFTQMILPQERQLGAAARRGWRVARHVHRREAGEAVERDGLVWSSRVRIAESCKDQVNS